MTTQFSPARRAEIYAEARRNVAGVPLKPGGMRAKYIESDLAALQAENATMRADLTALQAYVETLARTISGIAVDISDMRSFIKTSPQAGGELHWWQWTDQRIDARLEELTEELHEATGAALGEMIGRVRDEADQRADAEKREHELLRREFSVLRDEVGIERELKVRSQVARAQRAVPKLPANRGSAPRGGHDGETVGRAIAKAEYARRMYEGPFLEGEAKPVRTVNLIASPLGRR